jgi:hypothetical protein
VRRITICQAIACALFCASLEASIVLPRDFSATQGTDGIFYESLGDNRSSNVLNPNVESPSLLAFLGNFSFGYPNEVARPTYAHDQFFPFVQVNSDSGHLTLHPGTGGLDLGAGTASVGVAVRIDIIASGTYNIFGDFARNNANYASGNGVDVLVTRSLELDAPLFSAFISPNHVVDVAAPFSGTGVQSFDLTAHFEAGESIRFIVFGDAQGQDGTFDGTALRASIVRIAEVPEPGTFSIATIGCAIAAIFHRIRTRRNCVTSTKVVQKTRVATV